MDAQALRKARILSRREIEAQIAEGRAIVIVDNKVLKVDAWLPYHPGGDKAIRHMIGRDATDEVTRYVLKSTRCCFATLTAVPQLPFLSNPRAYDPLSNRLRGWAMDKLHTAYSRREVQDTSGA